MSWARAPRSRQGRGDALLRACAQWPPRTSFSIEIAAEEAQDARTVLLAPATCSTLRLCSQVLH